MKEAQCKSSFLIKQINEALGRQANKNLQSCGLTRVQAHLLMVLHHAGERGHSLKELEKYFQVSQPTIVGTVSRLEKKGLISSFQDPNDRRSKRVHLTPAGADHCRVAHEGMEKMDDFLVSGLTEEEQAEFYRLLRIVYQTVQPENPATEQQQTV